MRWRRKSSGPRTFGMNQKMAKLRWKGVEGEDTEKQHVDINEEGAVEGVKNDTPTNVHATAAFAHANAAFAHANATFAHANAAFANVSEHADIHVAGRAVDTSCQT